MTFFPLLTLFPVGLSWAPYTANHDRIAQNGKESRVSQPGRSQTRQIRLIFSPLLFFPGKSQGSNAQSAVSGDATLARRQSAQQMVRRHQSWSLGARERRGTVTESSLALAEATARSEAASSATRSRHSAAAAASPRRSRRGSRERAPIRVIETNENATVDAVAGDYDDG